MYSVYNKIIRAEYKPQSLPLNQDQFDYAKDYAQTLLNGCGYYVEHSEMPEYESILLTYNEKCQNTKPPFS